MEDEFVSVKCNDCGWGGFESELIFPYQECPVCQSGNIEYIDQ